MVQTRHKEQEEQKARIFPKMKMRYLERFIKVEEILGFTVQIMREKKKVLICTNGNRNS